jgi:hypothetical protein
MKNLFLIVLIIPLLTSCFPFDEGNRTQISDRFYLYQTASNSYSIGFDDPEYGDVDLLYSDYIRYEVVDDYIFVKTKDSPTDSAYYLIEDSDLSSESETLECIKGQFNWSDYNTRLRELGLTNPL